jgi:hypothetical protein
MMETDAVSETSVNLNHLVWLSAHEGFTEIGCSNGFQNSGSTFWYPPPKEVSEETSLKCCEMCQLSV